MADISKIEHNGSLYNVKDAVARSLANPSTTGASAGDLLAKTDASSNSWVSPSTLTVKNVSNSLSITTDDATITYDGAEAKTVTIIGFTAAEVDTIFDSVS